MNVAFGNSSSLRLRKQNREWKWTKNCFNKRSHLLTSGPKNWLLSILKLYTSSHWICYFLSTFLIPFSFSLIYTAIWYVVCLKSSLTFLYIRIHDLNEWKWHKQSIFDAPKTKKQFTCIIVYQVSLSLLSLVSCNLLLGNCLLETLFVSVKYKKQINTIL